MSAPVAVGATTGLDQDAIGGRRVTQNSSTTNLTNHPGATRLARGLAALVEAQERRPRTAAEACVLRGLEAMLGVRKLRQLAPRQPRQSSPDGLKTAAQAAAKLNCSIKTLNGHVASGALRYVAIGHGTKRPRKMFTDADINSFVANQTRKDVPCPSTASHARRIGTSIFGGEVIAFTALRKRRRDAKPKR